jgi:Na+-transporting methylmalonyl-CoA/oxaloacetate decarboxylase gamma subunit
LGQAAFTNFSPYTQDLESAACGNQTMSRLKRILIVMGIAVVVGGIYFWIFGVQTMSALMVRYTYRKIPQVSKVPVPLPDLSVSSVAHKHLSRLGYEFELPWDDVDEQKDKTVGAIHVSYFRF